MNIDDCIKNLSFQIGPFEIQEPNQICWNNNDWPIYIKCPFNVDIQKVIRIIQNGWNIKKPQIILSLISDFNSFNQWEVTENIKSQLTTGFCKAASSAKMWIITNGVDVGAPPLISTIVNNFKQWKKSISCDESKLYSAIETICIGIVREDKITSGLMMQKHLKNIQHLSDKNSKNQTKNKKMDKFFINEFHSHFIFVNSKEENELEQLLSLELMYQLSFETSWLKKENLNENIDRDKSSLFKLRKISRIPFVAILIQGDPSSSIITNEYLIKQIPVVVFKGSGGFADLLYFAYIEIKKIISNECEEIEDVHFLNNQFNFILKNKILYFFPELNNKEDKIIYLRQSLIDCVRHSSQDSIDYLTFIDVDEKKNYLSKLDEYLLNAHIKSTQIYQQDPTLLMTKNELFHKNLNLTLDWNCPNIAIEETQKILLKEPVYIDKKLFQRAIIEKNREKFIEIFMEAGFKVRQLYDLPTIEWFFNQALENEFFLIGCCERILDLQITSIFPNKNFLNNLNKLIFETTGYRNFIKKSDFVYQQRISHCIEFKMINFIVMWSVFTFKIELIRRIWRFDAQPIQLLLMVCNMLKNMASFVNDLNLVQQMHDYKNEFGQIATELLEYCSLKANFRAIQLLNLKSIHHENQIACDVAANAMVFSFIAHPTTQTWLTSIFMNGITVKKNSKLAILDKFIPESIKIILCVISFYPITFWLHFVKFSKQKYKSNERLRQIKFEQDFNESENCEHTLTKEDLECTSDKKSFKFKFLKQIYKEDGLFFYKWFLLMNAPITKFWISQIFFLLFLSLFTITVILPSCGNQYLHLILFIWYNLIVLEDIRKSYMILKNYISMNIKYKYLEIPLVLLFLIILYLGRILDYKPISSYQYYIKICMCFALLHNYFRFVAIYLPINATLGPLFYYLKQMSLHDSFFFLILCLPVLIGSGIIIQVSLYPDRPFDLTVIRMMLYRIFFNMFITLDDEFLYKNECLNSTLISDSKQCKNFPYINEECPNVNFWSYLFFITYLILLKLILMNILGAMFNTSLVTIDTQTIWRYQRFNLIMFFDLNSIFPPPFNIINYIYLLIKYLFILIKKLFLNQSSEKNNSLNDYCKECSDELKNYFWRTICDLYKNKMDQRLELETDLNLINKNQKYINKKLYEKEIKINELKSNLTEIEKTIFQLDYVNSGLTADEIVEKLKWIIRK